MQEPVARSRPVAAPAVGGGTVRNGQWSATVLAAAARFAHASGRSVTVVVPRTPGMVDRARAIADASGVRSTIAIGATGPTIVFGPVDRPDPRAAAAGP